MEYSPFFDTQNNNEGKELYTLPQWVNTRNQGSRADHLDILTYAMLVEADEGNLTLIASIYLDKKKS